MSEALIMWDHLENGIANITAVAAWLPFQHKRVPVCCGGNGPGSKGTGEYSHDQRFEWNRYFSFVNKNFENKLPLLNSFVRRQNNYDQQRSISHNMQRNKKHSPTTARHCPREMFK